MKDSDIKSLELFSISIAFVTSFLIELSSNLTKPKLSDWQNSCWLILEMSKFSEILELFSEEAYNLGLREITESLAEPW